MKSTHKEYQLCVRTYIYVCVYIFPSEDTGSLGILYAKRQEKQKQLMSVQHKYGKDYPRRNGSISELPAEVAPCRVPDRDYPRGSCHAKESVCVT